MTLSISQITPLHAISPAYPSDTTSAPVTHSNEPSTRQILQKPQRPTMLLRKLPKNTEVRKDREVGASSCADMQPDAQSES